MSDTPKIDKANLPSRHVSVGPKSAPHRSYYYAMGMTEEESRLSGLQAALNRLDADM